jgi:hypothetical protein
MSLPRLWSLRTNTLAGGWGSHAWEAEYPMAAEEDPAGSASAMVALRGLSQQVPDGPDVSGSFRAVPITLDASIEAAFPSSSAVPEPAAEPLLCGGGGGGGGHGGDDDAAVQRASPPGEPRLQSGSPQSQEGTPLARPADSGFVPNQPAHAATVEREGRLHSPGTSESTAVDPLAAMRSMLELAAARLALLSSELSEAITSQSASIAPKADEIARLWSTLEPALAVFATKTREANLVPTPSRPSSTSSSSSTLPFGFAHRHNAASEEELIRRGILPGPDRAALELPQ